nr:Vms1/Ankzf1 family peptidyl-tRNA hydrolase [Methanohalophilus levihalophilus]
MLILAAHAGESLLLLASEDEEEESRLIRSSVKAKHGKGGFSQRRFERLRDEDIVHHAEKVRQSLIEILGQAENPDYMILCGDLLLAEEIVKGIDLPVIPISRKIDAKIDPKDSGKLIKELLAYRRYRL